MPSTLTDQKIKHNDKPVDYRSLSTLITVFFFWGFVAASNDILIPVFKKEFDLTQAQSQLVSLAFYIAYTVGSDRISDVESQRNQLTLSLRKIEFLFKNRNKDVVTGSDKTPKKEDRDQC